MKEKIVIYPQVGKIAIVKRIYCRNIRLMVHPSKGIRVSIPFGLPFRSAENFIEEKLPWIIKMLKKQETASSQYKIDISNGAVTEIIGRSIRFTIIPDSAKISVIRENNVTSILYGTRHSREMLLDVFTNVLRIEAGNYLPNRTALLANRYGFKYNRLVLKNNRSNWGSCSSKANINLNIHLMRLPENLCDQIILHELCHLRHRNHGPEFHKLLNELSGGREKEMSKAIRYYHPYLA